MQRQRSLVTLYSVPGCLLCRRTRDFLVRRRIRFREVNVLIHPRVLLNLLNRYGRVLPVVRVGDKTVIGCDQRRLAAALEACA